MISRELAESLHGVLDRILQLAADDNKLRDALTYFCEDYLDAFAPLEDGDDVPAGRKDDRYEDDHRSLGGYDNDNYRRPMRSERPMYEPRGYTGRSGHDQTRYESRGGYERGYDRGDRGSYERGSYERPRYERPQRSDEAELTLIEQRCRLKSKGSRWAAERRRMINNGVDFRIEIDPKDREIIALAKSIPECFLWMNHPSGPSPANLNLFDELAGCYDTMAETVILLRELLPESTTLPELFNRAMDLAAEAQSALRAAVYKIDGPNDNDQNAVFHWLKRTASALQIFIQRYMRADDTANPANSDTLTDRVQCLRKEIGKARIVAQERAKHMTKIRPMIEDLAAADNGGTKTAWLALANAIDDMLEAGVSTTDAELKTLLTPLLRSIPNNSKYPASFNDLIEGYEQAAEAPAPAATESEES